MNTTQQVLIRIFTLHCMYVCMGVLHRATQKIKLLIKSVKFMHMCMLSIYPADRVSCVPQNTQSYLSCHIIYIYDHLILTFDHYMYFFLLLFVEIYPRC